MQSFIILVISLTIGYGLLTDNGNAHTNKIINDIQVQKNDMYCKLHNELSLENQKRLDDIYKPTNMEKARCNIENIKKDFKKLFD